jgi:hypothetical protein
MHNRRVRQIDLKQIDLRRNGSGSLPLDQDIIDVLDVTPGKRAPAQGSQRLAQTAAGVALAAAAASLRPPLNA